METILVTGGAGFIGSHVCSALLKNSKVICVDNFNNYYSSEIKRKNIELFTSNRNFILNETDIVDIDKLKKIFMKNRPDKIIHLAARAGVRPSVENPFIYEETNVRGTLNLLETAKEFNVKNFIFGSSSSVYGNNKKIPFSENDPTDNAISPYAATKKSGEILCHTYSYLYGINITCLRFFTVYGPNGRPDMAPYIFTKLINEGKQIIVYGDGTSKRDYTYIEDIVSGIISSLNKSFRYEIINLGNSKTVELNHLISTIEKILGKKAKILNREIPKGDVSLTYADITKAKKLLGYSPGTTIEQGMKEFIEWYKDN